jgi:two-component system sensor histidine kinase HydH
MQTGRWARWGWLASAFAMAAALLVTAWIGRARVENAASTLNRGQGEVVLESVRQLLRSARINADPTALDSILARQSDAGVRYIALFDDDSGEQLASAGKSETPTPEVTRYERRPPEILTIGNRVRVTAGAFVANEDLTADDDGRDRRRRAPYHMMVLEFAPVVAQQLASEATRTFLLSALVAAALFGVSFVFWRLTAAQEAAERRLEQQRRLGILGEMSAVLAHEIRNPLASLKGNAQLLAERLPDDTAERRKAQLVVHEAQRLETLTTDLLDFARSGPIELIPTDPVALVRTCVADVDDSAVTLHTEGAPASWPLDAQWMRQALTNVLRNARQSSPEGRPLDVTVGTVGDALEIVVRDYGPGIVAGDETRIFSPFYTTRTNGTGLGLAVALRVAQMHAGTVTARTHTASGGGAEFRFTIPRR